MSKFSKIWSRICSKWTKIRLRPIRVYCLHHVSKQFNADMMHKCDWMSINDFQKKTSTLQKGGVRFISLIEAHKHIKKDLFRRKKYAVITFDDGWTSIREIIPWLCKQQIPITLFLNPAYLIGEEEREKGVSLKENELAELLKYGTGMITIASHGWNHGLCTELSMPEFEQNVNRSEAFLSKYNEYIPFFAYPCGRRAEHQDDYLQSKNIVPVYMDGIANYSNTKAIHRELLS